VQNAAYFPDPFIRSSQCRTTWSICRPDHSGSSTSVLFRSFQYIQATYKLPFVASLRTQSLKTEKLCWKTVDCTSTMVEDRNLRPALLQPKCAHHPSPPSYRYLQIIPAVCTTSVVMSTVEVLPCNTGRLLLTFFTSVLTCECPRTTNPVTPTEGGVPSLPHRPYCGSLLLALPPADDASSSLFDAIPFTPP
jgi:hypothetical protein